MRSILIVPVLLVLYSCAHAQTEQGISIGKKEMIYSRILNENRRIWVYTPGITSQSIDTTKRYPVLYLLDGDAHFFSTVGIIQQLSQANGNGVLPEMIVVAIENTNRLRDLVPPADSTKANPFIDFLSSELIPHINKQYNTSSYKLLVGHSLGGLTAIDLLSRSPQLFNACIAIDPSMWYNNERILNNVLGRLSEQQMNGRKLFIGTANTLPQGMTITQLKNDRSTETQHIRSILKLNDSLKKYANGLLYTQKYYEEERHNTVPLLSEYDGLRFIFDYYHLDATEKDFTDSTNMLAVKLKAHYVKVSANMGYKNAAPETLINYLAYDALGKKQYTKAKALFELNMEWYPESSNALDSYADYFLTRKDTTNAIIYYKKALQLNHNDATQHKLNMLLPQQTSVPATADLQRYAGVYILETYGIAIILEIRDARLWAKMQGEEDDELQFLTENVFTVKGKQGYTITFTMEGNKPTGFTSVQPNGIFKGVYKTR